MTPSLPTPRSQNETPHVFTKYVYFLHCVSFPLRISMQAVESNRNFPRSPDGVTGERALGKLQEARGCRETSVEAFEPAAPLFAH